MNLTGLHKKLNSRLDKAVWEHQLFHDGDRIIAAVSGGADSMALLYLLKQRLSIYARDLWLHAVYVDLGFGKDAEIRCQCMQSYFNSLEIPATLIRTQIGPMAHSRENQGNPCFYCSRIRRKKLFETAETLEAKCIAFGHHKDDVVETLLLNMIFGREISSMIPHLRVMGGTYSIIRPLYYADEEMIKRFVRQKQIPTVDQQCPTDGHSKRQYVKDLVRQIEKDHRGARENIFKSLRHVKSSYLLQNAE